MRFIAVLNKDIKPGLAVNALAQMALGLGHRFAKGYPDICIYWGSTANVRVFRAMVAASKNMYSDFPHTMQGGNTSSLLEGIESTPEEDITYYAACYVADEIEPNIQALLNEQMDQLANYTAFISTELTTLLPPGDHTHPPKEDTKKTTTMVNAKQPLAATINSIVLANIDAGRIIPYNQLNLLRIGRLQGVSFNTHPILKADNPAKHIAMTQKAQEEKGLYVVSRAIDDKQPLVTVTFGERDLVESTILKKLTRMFEPSVEFIKPKGANLASPRGSLSLFGGAKEVEESPDARNTSTLMH